MTLTITTVASNLVSAMSLTSRICFLPKDVMVEAICWHGRKPVGYPRRPYMELLVTLMAICCPS